MGSPRASVFLLAALSACTGPGPGSTGDTGALAGDDRIDRYLDTALASRLVIEVDDLAGQPVPEGLWDDLALSWGDLTGKPDVEVRMTSLGVDPTSSWTRDIMDELALTEADEEAEDEVHVQVLLLPGAFDLDVEGTVLGRGWDHHHIALFVEAIDASCAAATDDNWSAGRAARLCDATWRGIASHELGHVLGLVNQGLAMVDDHEDPEHRGHDVTDGCLMYWAFDGAGVASHLAQRSNGGSEEVEELGFCAPSLADVDARRAGR